MAQTDPSLALPGEVEATLIHGTPLGLPSAGEDRSAEGTVLHHPSEGQRAPGGDNEATEAVGQRFGALLERTEPEARPAVARGKAAPSAANPEAPEAKDVLLGQMLGEYRVEARIGHGGMGLVYRGRHPVIGKPVAIKVLRKDVAQDPEHVERLIAEARAVNAIRHRGIIDIFGFGQLPSGQPYVVMEYLEGISLDRLISERAPLPAAEVLAILEDLLGALGAAHAAGVIHRDLKPSNLVLVQQPDGTRYLKVLDFGLSKKSAVPRGATAQTRTHQVVGTPEYMAPEQARALPVSPATDLYAVGVLAYELLTGSLPFEGGTPMELLMKHVEEPPPKLSLKVPGVAPELESLVARMLEKEPERRPPSAELLLKDVRRLRIQLSAAATQVRSARAVASGPLGRAPLPSAMGERPEKEVTDPEGTGVDTWVGSPRAPTEREAPVSQPWLGWQRRAEVALGATGSRVRRIGVAAGAVGVLGLLAWGLGWANRPWGTDVEPVAGPLQLRPAGESPRAVATQAALRERISRLERGMRTRLRPGETPDAAALSALLDYRSQVERAESASERARLGQALDAWQERFASHR